MSLLSTNLCVIDGDGRKQNIVLNCGIMAKNVINRVRKNEKKNSLSVLIIPMIAMGWKTCLGKGMYNAVMPMWDNTPRRNNRGNVIFHGSTPDLYKKWLMDIILHYQNDCILAD